MLSHGVIDLGIVHEEDGRFRSHDGVREEDWV